MHRVTPVQMDNEFHILHFRLMAVSSAETKFHVKIVLKINPGRRDAVVRLLLDGHDIYKRGYLFKSAITGNELC